MKRLWNQTMRRVYDWSLRLSAGPAAVGVFCALAFAESILFPIPLDLLLIPLVLARRKEAFRIALYATVFNVAGGLLGYLTGWFLYDTVGMFFIRLYHYAHQFDLFCNAYNAWGGWIVFAAALTPFPPYKAVALASGVTQLDVTIFLLASAAGRGIRYFAVAFVLWKYGHPIRHYIEKNLGWLSAVVFCLLIAGFVLLNLF